MKQAPCWILASILVGAVAGIADDALPTAVQTAKNEFADQSQRLRARLYSSLDAREKSARRKGDKDLLAQAIAVRTAVENSSQWPVVLFKEASLYQKQMLQARLKLDRACRQAIKDSIKSKMDARAQAIEQDYADAFRDLIRDLSRNELVTNGGCEDYTAQGESIGWGVVEGKWARRTADPPPRTGTGYFFANKTALGELFQEIDVSEYAQLIDESDICFELTAWVKSFPQRNPDTTRIIVHYLDARKKSILSTFDSGEKDNTQDWQQIADNRTAPKGTRYIRIRLQSRRNEGTDNDGYFDDVSLRIAVPKPKSN